MHQHILLLGPPASGKGTQARNLAAHLNVSCLGTGKLLRDEIEAGSEIGRQAEGFMNRGAYVPDEVIMSMVGNWLDQNQSGWLLDGFPRTKPQAEALNHIQAPSIVIALDVPQEDLEFRITKRRECTSCGATVAVENADDEDCPVCGDGKLVSRSDDALDSFKLRYAQYTELTQPLFDYYSDLGLLKRVDGTLKPDMVYQSILDLL